MSANSIFYFPFRVLRKINRALLRLFDQASTLVIVYGNNVKLGKKVKFNGVPFIDVNKSGTCRINDNCSFNSRVYFNPIGRNQKCQIVVGKDAVLSIGKNVGVSSSAIICYKSITIGNNVKIGGNTVIYDSDFHSLDFLKRKKAETDIPERKNVVIEDDVFIGSHVTILKGVQIGARSVVAAGSVVSKSIPPDEVWGGNPAKRIR